MLVSFDNLNFIKVQIQCVYLSILSIWKHYLYIIRRKLPTARKEVKSRAILSSGTIIYRRSFFCRMTVQSNSMMVAQTCINIDDLERHNEKIFDRQSIEVLLLKLKKQSNVLLLILGEFWFGK